MKIFQSAFLHPRFWLSWLGLGLMRLSVFLPASLQLRIGRLLGALLRPFMRSRERIAARNLELCFPEMTEAERAELLKENMLTMGTMPIETAMSWWGSDRQLQNRVVYQGLEHIESALSRGKGIILLTGHFTSMEMGGRLIMRQFPAYVMFRELKNPLFNQVMLKFRTLHSEGTILQEEPRAMLRALKKNKIVWYAPDQDYGRRFSIQAKFFGISAATVPATARMARMSGAAVVPFVPVRDHQGGYKIKVFPALEQFPSEDELADTQRINDWVEAQIRQCPAQYFWVHRRFKTQPEGKGNFYRNNR
ncbi:LpxL/LpxP family Kdo(2)-lipid IV(A) lauroyl/palmitoleoyl acyltransferase [Methylophaga lonarensis]|uniref:LpxL/LpxP family Kdo(2)-lipid IV(A) lauroyl/palmitoleoyl acyltransferase n=1 Tax=Methylophaga lonarensis TaxID=999151 RepID=UPI003D2C0154